MDEEKSFINLSWPFLLPIALWGAGQMAYHHFVKQHPGKLLSGLSCVKVHCCAQFLSMAIETFIYLPPFILYLGWGSMVIQSDKVSSHIGFAVCLLFSGLHSLIIGRGMWKARKWRFTIPSAFFLAMGTTFIWGYLFIVVQFSDWFSYSGTTAIFMSFSFVLVSLMYYRIDNRRSKIDVDSFLRVMDNEDNRDKPLMQIIKIIQRNNLGGHIMFMILTIGFYALVMGDYAFVVYNDGSNSLKLVGAFNTMFVAFIDVIILAWATFTTSQQVFTSPIWAFLAFLAPRAVIIYLPQYWIMMHSLGFFITLIILSTQWMANNIVVKNSDDVSEGVLFNTISKSKKLQTALKDEMGIDIDFEQEAKGRFGHVQKGLIYVLGESLPILLVLAGFTGYYLGVAFLDFDKAVEKLFHFDEMYQQHTFCGVAIVSFLCYFFTALWIRYFQASKYNFNWKNILALFICINGAVIFAIIFSIATYRKSPGALALSLSSFVCFPIWAMSVAIIYGISWGPKLPKKKAIKQKMDQLKEDANTDAEGSDDELLGKGEEEEKEGGEEEDEVVEAEDDKDIGEEKEEKDGYGTFEGKDTPSTKPLFEHTPLVNKIIVTIITIFNVIFVLLYFAANLVFLKDKWIPLLVGSWIVIVQYSLFFVKKFTVSGYKWCDPITIISLLLSVVFQIISAVIFFGMMYISKHAEDKQKFAFVFLLLHCVVVPAFFYYFMNFYIHSLFRTYAALRVVASLIAGLVFIIIGAALVLGQQPGAGCALIIFAVTLAIRSILEIDAIENKLGAKWIWRILAIVVSVSCVIATVVLIVMHHHKIMGLVDSISMVGFLWVGFFFTRFYLLFIENRRLAQNQIQVFSQHIVPMFKLEPETFGRSVELVEDNDEFKYFNFAVGGLFAWTAFASFLVKDEFVYVGLSLNAFSIVLATLYIIDRYSAANCMSMKTASKISHGIYRDLQVEALKYRQELTLTASAEAVDSKIDGKLDENEKKLLDKKESILGQYNEWQALTRQTENASGSFLAIKSYIASTLNKLSGIKEPEDLTGEQARIKNELDEKTDTASVLGLLRKCYERNDKENYYNLQYTGYLVGQIKLYSQQRKSKIQAKLDSLVTKLQTTATKMELSRSAFPQQSIVVVRVVDWDGNDWNNFDNNYDDIYEQMKDRDRRCDEGWNNDINNWNTRNDIIRINDNIWDDSDWNGGGDMQDIIDEMRRKQEEEINRIINGWNDNQDDEWEQRRREEEERRRREEIERRRREEEARRQQEEERLRRRKEEEDKRRKDQEERDQQDDDDEEQKDDDEAPKPKPRPIVSTDVFALDDQTFQEEGDRILDGSPYTDYEFNGNGAKYINNSYKQSGADWSSLQETSAKNAISRNGGRGGDPILFSNEDEEGIDLTDINQGYIGDCWFMSAIAGVAYTRPDLIRRIFHSKCNVEDGKYVIRFWKQQKQHIVTIDDNLMTYSTGQAAFMDVNYQNGKIELWAALLEKAYAKLHGSYEAIEGGWASEGLADLTGGIGRTLNFNTDEFQRMSNNGTLFSWIQKCLESGNLVGCGSKSGSDSDSSANGVVLGHAFTICDAIDFDGEQLLLIRNPHGTNEYHGPWSDQDSYRWNDERKARIKRIQQEHGRETYEIGNDDGLFWIPLNYFCSEYSSIDLCYLFDSEGVKREAISGNTAYNTNLRMYVKGEGNTKVYLRCGNSRMDEGDNNMNKIGLLMQCTDANGRSIRSCRSFCQGREYDYFEADLSESGSPYSIELSSYDGATTDFNLVTYSMCEVQIES